MPQKPTAYYRPSDLDEVLRFLRQPNTVPLAGGTNLLATEEGIDSAVVDLQDAGLDQLTWADDGRLLRIGAMVRLAGPRQTQGWSKESAPEQKARPLPETMPIIASSST